MVDGDGGMKAGSCFNRAESSPLNDTSKSLVLMNFFRSMSLKPLACVQNSGALINMLQTCHAASANRWANFIAVDYFKVHDKLTTLLIASSSILYSIVLKPWLLCCGKKKCRGVREEERFKLWTLPMGSYFADAKTYIAVW